VTTKLFPTDKVTAETKVHENCVVCGPLNDRGLRLQFETMEDGSVQTTFDCDQVFEGYRGRLHGGVISALLDGVMTHCIFAHGHTGVTAELKVRYRHPVVVEETAIIRGWIRDPMPPLYIMAGELVQNGQVKATAIAKFMDQPELAKDG